MPDKPLSFDFVRDVAGALPGIEESTGPGTPWLKVRGTLLTSPAIRKPAEPHSLVVKIGFDRRAKLIAADPDVYYVTSFTSTTRLSLFGCLGFTPMPYEVCRVWRGNL